MRLQKNMGAADRLIRNVVAIGLLGLVLAGAAKGIVAAVLLLVGALLLATSALSSCPLYTVLGISTGRVRETG